MTDSFQHRDDLDGEAPDPIVFDPASPVLPPDLDAVARSGPLVVLLDQADDPGWAADSAIALASTWASQGRRVVLADLHLEEPVLHQRVGEANLDGVVDIFLYGASVARSARPPRGHEFFLIPAGTYTASPQDVYRHPRWQKLVTGFREAGATLLVFLPRGTEGAEELVGAAQAVILLGRPDDAMGSPPPAVRAVLVPPGSLAGGAATAAGEATPPLPASAAAGSEPDLELGEPPFEEPPTWAEPAEPDATEPASEPPGSSEGYLAAWAGDEPAAVMPDGPPPTPEPLVSEPDEPHEPVPPMAPLELEPREPVGMAPNQAAASAVVATEAARGGAGAAPHGPMMGPSRRRRRTGPGPMIWLLVVFGLLVAGVLVAAVLRPDLFGGTGARGGAAGADTIGAAAVPPAPPAPAPVGDTLAFAVQVRAYASLDRARSEVERQSRRAPDAGFYIVPELTQGVLYYKVMAGMLPDTAEALRMQQSLVEAGVVAAEDARETPTGSWSLIQQRPLSFNLGEYPDRGEAAAHADSLSARGIPAYAALFPYSDGTQRYRLYAGAYADSTQADELRRILRDQELPARLVTRIGRPPPTTQ